MPLYEWCDKTTGFEVTVLRPFADYQVPPAEDELPEAERGKERNWVRQIGGGQQVQKGLSWGPGKGHWIQILIPLLAFLYSTTGRAAEFHLLDTEEISMDAWNTTYRRDPYQPEYTGKWRDGVAANLNLRLLKVFRWENRVHSDGTESQLRNVGWEFRMLMDWNDYLQPFYYHHSQHAMDSVGADDPRIQNDFPVQDSWGIRLIFFKKGRDGK